MVRIGEVRQRDPNYAGDDPYVLANEFVEVGREHPLHVNIFQLYNALTKEPCCAWGGRAIEQQWPTVLTAVPEPSSASKPAGWRHPLLEEDPFG